MKVIYNTTMALRFLVVMSLCLVSMTMSAQDAQVNNEETQIDPDILNNGDGPPPGNPFRNGTEGTWRVKRSYVLQVDRTQTRAGQNDNVNLRIDGVYNTFYPFWELPDASSKTFWRITNKEQWTFTQQINHYNPFGGFVLENVNPLGIHAASLYGFNNTLPVAVAGNARYREVGVDSFEDYMYSICANRHFSFRNSQGIESKVTTRASHTGRYSLKLAPKETLSMFKSFAPCQSDSRPPIR